MILVDSGTRDDRSFDGLIVLASQLAEAGYQVGIDQAILPEKLSTNQRYQVARLLVDPADHEISGILIAVTDGICSETLSTLRAYRVRPQLIVAAVGRFDAAQDRIDCQLKLSYAIGRIPTIIDLADFGGKTLDPASVLPLATGIPSVFRASDSMHDLCVVLPPDWSPDAAMLGALGTLRQSGRVRLRIMASGTFRDAVEASGHSGLPMTDYDEFLPGVLSRQTDLAVFFGDRPPIERMMLLARDMVRQGRIVIDSTTDAILARSAAPVLRGPVDLGMLYDYLRDVVWPNRDAILRKVATSAWKDGWTIERLAAAAGLAAPSVGITAKQATRPKTLFLPTNGVGLGHARRCLLIADAMTDQRDIVFAAYPSCLPMIADRSYPALPLVQRSGLHVEPYANDIVNYLRLKDNLRNGDTLVFDGGYVFNSVHRTIVENELSAVWIRRGLWQPAHVTPAALRRESTFARIIVPDEAFDELNHDYTFGPNVHHVGPIVAEPSGKPADRLALRARLMETLGSNAGNLVVTMLGSGTVTERDAQTRYICHELERRGDCLNLVVIWPGSETQASLFHWKNTRVIQTRDALAFCQIADLVISATGYNSFHECLYSGIPTIFMPQVAPTADDQLQRARAASDRGLAETVLSSELMRLGREIRLFLDEGKAGDIREALAAHQFPLRGTAAAAVLIDGVGK